MITKIEIDLDDIDLDRFKKSVHSIIGKREWDQNQISLQHRIGITQPNESVGSISYAGDVKSDIEFSEFYDDFKNEYAVQVLKGLDFDVYRTRIMKISPKRCYTMHRDKTIRYHIPIDIAEGKSRFIFDHGEVINMEEGKCYVVNTKLEHTAMNCHPSLDRIHIVGCLEERHETSNIFVREIYDEFEINNT